MSIKTSLGQCHFVDCVKAMKELETGSFDLCFTDPPYDQPLLDRENPYENYTVNHEWLEEARRVATTVICTPGVNKIYDYPKPTWTLLWLKPGCTTHNITGGFSTWEPLLYYGGNTIYNDSFRTTITKPRGMKHPCARPVSLWLKVLRQLKHPITSILDCFLGSGCTCEAAEFLGIKWLGFEIDETYKEDIVKRMH